MMDPMPPGKVHTVLDLDKKVETTEAYHLPKPPSLSLPCPQKLWRPHLSKYSDDEHLPKPQKSVCLSVPKSVPVISTKDWAGTITL